MAKGCDLERGSIIKVPLDDFQGTVASHFAVILSSTEAIQKGDPLVVAGISTRDETPLPPGQFFMDYTPGRPHPETGLSESSVVKGDWINVIKQSDITDRFKKCKARTFKLLIEFVNANLPPSTPTL